MLGGREAERAIFRPKMEKDVGLRNNVLSHKARRLADNPKLDSTRPAAESLANWNAIVQSPKAFLGRCLSLDLTQKRRKDHPP